jgi:hypothetical protein
MMSGARLAISDQQLAMAEPFIFLEYETTISASARLNAEC